MRKAGKWGLFCCCDIIYFAGTYFAAVKLLPVVLEWKEHIATEPEATGKMFRKRQIISVFYCFK